MWTPLTSSVEVADSYTEFALKTPLVAAPWRDYDPARNAGTIE